MPISGYSAMSRGSTKLVRFGGGDQRRPKTNWNPNHVIKRGDLFGPALHVVTHRRLAAMASRRAHLRRSSPHPTYLNGHSTATQTTTRHTWMCTTPLLGVRELSPSHVIGVDTRGDA